MFGYVWIQIVACLTAMIGKTRGYEDQMREVPY